MIPNPNCPLCNGLGKLYVAHAVPVGEVAPPDELIDCTQCDSYPRPQRSTATVAQRLEDTRGRQNLTLTKDVDGDIVITLEVNPASMAARYPSIEFCTPNNDGSSPRTYQALRALFDAMVADNLDPACARRKGTRGKGVEG